MSGSSINNNASIAFFSSHSFFHYVKWLESENLLVPGILAFRNSKPPHTYVRANLCIFPIVQSSLFNLVAGKANSTSLSSMDSLSIYMPIYTILMLSTGYLSLSLLARRDETAGDDDVRLKIVAKRRRRSCAVVCGKMWNENDMTWKLTLNHFLIRF